MSIISSGDLKIKLFRPAVAQCVFAFFLILLCAQLVNFSLGLWRRHAPNTAENTTVTLNNPQQQIQEDLMLNWPLFGEYVPKQFGDMHIKRSTLDLQVVGILYSTNAQDSEVILRSSSGSEKSYKIDEKLPGGAILKQVSSNEVLVMHHGELESLSLPKNKLIFEPPTKEIFPP